jgi:O-antigen/teichoic acid export membrane protein
MLLKSTLIYAPAVLLVRLSSLVLLVIATRLMSPDAYGLLTLVVAVGELADMALANWLRIAFLRLGGTGEITRGSVMRALLVSALTTGLAIFLALAVTPVIVPEDPVAFGLAVTGYLIAGAVVRFVLTLLQMRQRQAHYALLETLRAALQIVLPVAVMVVGWRDFVSVSMAASAGALIAASIGAMTVIPGLVAGPARFGYRELLAFGIPLMVMALMGFGLNNAERIVLKIYHDAAAVALFAAVYALARQPIDMVGNAVNMGGFPEFVARFDRDGAEGAGHFLSEQMAVMLALSLPVAGLLVALSPDVTELVLPPAYQGHSHWLFPLIGLAVIQANLKTFVFDNVVHAFKRPWLMIWSLAPGSAATIGLSFLLVPMFATEGAAMALAGGAFVSLSLSIFISRRLLKVPVPMKVIAQAVAISAAAALAARGGAWALGDALPICRLALGGLLGVAVAGVGFSLVFPAETARLARRLNPLRPRTA